MSTAKTPTNARKKAAASRRSPSRGPQWTVADAKARFSEVIDKAASDGPQTITRNGKPAAVIVGAEEWERKTRRKGTLLEFFMSSPLRGADLDLERLKDPPREIEL